MASTVDGRTGHTLQSVGSFQAWLTHKLQSVSSDIDTDVFVSYIIGILDTDSPEEDSQESITELLSGVVEPDLAQNVCAAILEQWVVDMDSRRLSHVQEDVGDKLSRMFEKQTLATVKEKKLSKEEADRKAAILAQYGQVSDGEESDPDGLSEEENSLPSGGSSLPGSVGAKSKGDLQDSNDCILCTALLVRNVNKEEVQRVEREKRDKAKEDQDKKKEKDKQDRQAQKQKQQERRESEKKRTQKGEKRR